MPPPPPKGAEQRKTSWRKSCLFIDPGELGWPTVAMLGLRIASSIPSYPTFSGTTLIPLPHQGASDSNSQAQASLG